jgi:hypothetical protein
MTAIFFDEAYAACSYKKEICTCLALNLEIQIGSKV